jgi:1-aminocyclopropane-1-carboxylate deaminase/D-cysteine desulfhydrase-like pyridoxal-dependent ACC family enzyme
MATAAFWPDLPRVRLAPLPTPLTPARRLSAAIGVEVWLKRDDVGAVALAGSKVRKLELLLGRARSEGADTIVTVGAAQSNAARTAAAAAAATGMGCVLILGGDPPPQASGNLLLDRILGADVRFAGAVDWRALDERAQAVADELRAAGRRPVALPVGCSSPLGAVGFVLAHAELMEQVDAVGIEPAWVYHASTSGGTHAGLVVGRALSGRGPRIRAVSAGRVHDDARGHHRHLAREAAAMLGRHLPEPQMHLDESQVGEGYGTPTPAALEAIDLLARTEGVVCDPVYSGKGLAGLVADARANRVRGPVVFWHTGGAPAIFDPCYGSALGGVTSSGGRA